MSEENGQPDFDTIVLGLRTIQKEIQGRVAAKQAELDAILAEKKKIDQMLAAATRTGHHAAKSKNPPGMKGISEETLEVIWQKLQTGKFQDGEFTGHDVEAVSGTNKSTALRAVQILRDQGRIRLVGQRYLNPHTRGGRPAKTYVISG